jgi:hypothetical protein
MSIASILTQPSPSEWLSLTSLNATAPVGKALDRDAGFIVLTGGAATQETEVGDSLDVKVSKQWQNSTCFFAEPQSLRALQFVQGNDFTARSCHKNLLSNFKSQIADECCVVAQERASVHHLALRH